jgi:gas vesicle protein
MGGKIRQWWNKLERDQFNGMSPRKEYNQVAKDLIDANADASPRLIADAVLRREIEHQANQYSQRLATDVRSDAKEVADALRGFGVDATSDSDQVEKEAAAHEKAAKDAANLAKSKAAEAAATSDTT